jgi:16S rRNA (guanine1516-N2)-methyltransferase
MITDALQPAARLPCAGMLPEAARSSLAGVCAADEPGLPAAEALAAELSLRLLPLGYAGRPETPTGQLVLSLRAGRLELAATGRRAPGGVAADFCGELQRELAGPGAGRRRALARAAGLGPGESLQILDATAGLGRDAFRLASLGCQVMLVERSPIVAALLSDGIRRASADSSAASAVGRMRLVTGDAREVLRRAPRPDVVLIDPMYPPARKSAAPGRELALLRRLLGSDEDAGELLEAARAAALRRVVVKRRAHDPPLDGVPPDLSWPGRSTRFDVYLASHRGN